MDDFDVVDQETFTNVIDERSRVSKFVGELDEFSDVLFGGFAISSSSWDELNSFTEENDTFLDSSGISGSDISNTSGDFMEESFTVSNAGLDVIKDGLKGDSVKETLGELKDFFLGVNRGDSIFTITTEENGVHGSTNPVSEGNEIVLVISSEGLVDFTKDFNTVNDEALSNIVDEGNRVLEGLDHLDKSGNVSTASLALLNSSRESFTCFTNKGNTFLDFLDVLGFN